MGACFDSRCYNGNLTFKAIEAQFKNDQTEDRYENGHSYSGGIGMADGLELRPNTFQTQNEAWDWLQDNCQKWKAALAVRVEGNAPRWCVGAWCAS
jgi:hypothetical protein